MLHRNYTILIIGIAILIAGIVVASALTPQVEIQNNQSNSNVTDPVQNKGKNVIVNLSENIEFKDNP